MRMMHIRELLHGHKWYSILISLKVLSLTLKVIVSFICLNWIYMGVFAFAKCDFTYEQVMGFPFVLFSLLCIFEAIYYFYLYSRYNYKEHIYFIITDLLNKFPKCVVASLFIVLIFAHFTVNGADNVWAFLIIFDSVLVIEMIMPKVNKLSIKEDLDII